MTSEYEQLELPLEWPVHSHYTVELRNGNWPSMDNTVRVMEAPDADGAFRLIDGFRELAESRNNVTWQNDEVDANGVLMGLEPGGVVWEIIVKPPLSQELG